MVKVVNVILFVSTQDDLDSTTLDIGKLSEVPEITKVLICFDNSIIGRLVMANIYRRQIIIIDFVGKLNFLTKDVFIL